MFINKKDLYKMIDDLSDDDLNKVFDFVKGLSQRKISEELDEAYKDTVKKYDSALRNLVSR